MCAGTAFWLGSQNDGLGSLGLLEKIDLSSGSILASIDFGSAQTGNLTGTYTTGLTVVPPPSRCIPVGKNSLRNWLHMHY